MTAADPLAQLARRLDVLAGQHVATSALLAIVANELPAHELRLDRIEHLLHAVRYQLDLTAAAVARCPFEGGADQ